MTDQPAPWWHGTRGEWYVVAQGALLALVALGPRQWAGVPTWPAEWSGVSTMVGVALMAGGGLFGALGGAHLGRNLTAVPRPKQDANLVDTGAYAWVRHPIYCGLIVAAFGWALWVNSWLTVGYAVVLAIFFDIKARREERWLSEKFPGYAAYQRRVKKLIPFVY